jgi:rhamnosyltransferase
MASSFGRPQIAVLFAAYNGMRWIEEQLGSILRQQDVAVTVFISDDQSTDGTWGWCKEISAREPRVVVLPVSSERFGGAAKNFFRLVKDVDFSDFDYICYADQDDIWLSDKLINAHRLVVAKDASAVSTNVVAFWSDGREQLIDKAQPLRKFDYLFEAGGPGCSYVLKVTDALLFKRFLIGHWDDANEVALHDWLTYAWFRANGLRWVIDPLPSLRYRQHGGNQMGANDGFSAVFRRLRLLRSGWYRGEIRKIAHLVGPFTSNRPEAVISKNGLSRTFILRNISETRRKPMDRGVLFLSVLLGLY